SACKMTITDTRFGAEIVTKKGKTYKFDDMHCILEFMRSGAVGKNDIGKTYLVDFSGNGNLIDAGKAHLYRTDEIRSPMGGNVAAFSSEESLRKVSAQHKGTATTWKELAK
ncbi:MAG TPA: nitrous oxide reductase accessory protein NosL, partial [Chitinophagaceae bacterium]